MGEHIGKDAETFVIFPGQLELLTAVGISNIIGITIIGITAILVLFRNTRGHYRKHYLFFRT